ncbi:MAG TPA: hypothetical protein VEX89_00655 [Actinomycetes bacterium]|nr:hypothetical protein [Actinomycetes bacterium]
MTVTDHGDLVSALLGVPGVAAAAVEPAAGGPGTLRLQLAPGADEVGVAGAVNRMLRSRFGLAVDADRVRVLGEPLVRPAVIPANGLSTQSNSVVAPELRPDVRPEVRAEPRPDPRPEVRAEPRPDPRPEVRAEPRPEVRADPGPAVRPAGAPADGDVWHPTPRRPLPAAVEATPAPAPAAARSTPRLLIERVQLVSSGLTTSVTVALSHDGRTVEGRADGTATAGSLHRSVAHATLRAVEQVTDDVRFDVEHVEVAQTGPDRTALVVVSMVTERANQRLSGASVVREDVRQAVIRAVLAAVNRRLEPLIADVDLAAPTGPAGGREDLRR